ncbi:MAG: hypothetical protein AAGA63_04940 [Pseudomonadota bacterium]
MSFEAEKTLARAYWQACDTGGDISQYFAERFIWDGPRPAPRATNIAELNDAWLHPFRAACPDMTRSTHILMVGASDGKVDGGPDGRIWVGGTGYLIGLAKAPLWTIPARDTPLRIRWGEFLCIEDGKITEVHLAIDLMDWLEQIGLSVLPKFDGASHVWPAPTAFDGVEFDPVGTTETMELGRGLLFGGLNAFDESALTSMGMADYFHPNLKWYGPGGIGACLSLKEFQDFHQGPWLRSFPDRKVQDLPLIAEGRLLGACGPAAVKGTHGGEAFRSSGPGQGQPIEFSGLDFWLRTDDAFTENWVFVDFVKLFECMDIDLMDRVGQL